MGSRNIDGSTITPINHSYRNLGQAITVNQAGVQADIENTVYARPAPVIQQFETEEVSLVKGSNSVKLTNSSSGDLVERTFILPGESLPVADVGAEKVDFTVVGLAPTVKITESRDDSVIERHFGS